MNITFLETNQIKLEKQPKSYKKLTGTRLATVMGLNAWSSPFQAWCEITRTWEDTFTESKYTNAGKVIEPKVIEYLNDVYFMDVQQPEDVYGDDFFKKTWGNFFADKHDILGGMWDGLGEDFVVEVKTTKRIEDWVDGIPMYYKLQASLYAWLLGFDKVVVTVSVLQDSDYDNPEDYEPSSDNTQIIEFLLSEEYDDFEEEYIKPALQFWEDYVLTGISPVFDVTKRGDAGIIKDLRTDKKVVSHTQTAETVEPIKLSGDKSNDEAVKQADTEEVVRLTEQELADLMKEADELNMELTKHDAPVAEKRKRFRKIKGMIKADLVHDITDKVDRVERISEGGFTYVVTAPTRTTIDIKAVEEDYPNVVKNYTRTSVTKRMNVK